MGKAEYIEQIRNCEISAEDALNTLKYDFAVAQRTLAHIKDVFEALEVTSAVFEVEAALERLDAADSYRSDPFLI